MDDFYWLKGVQGFLYHFDMGIFLNSMQLSNAIHYLLRRSVGHRFRTEEILLYPFSDSV